MWTSVGAFENIRKFHSRSDDCSGYNSEKEHVEYPVIKIKKNTALVCGKLGYNSGK